jgi:putative endonuclease
MERLYFVYILASKRNGTLYVGITNDLVRRVGEHKSGKVEGFTKKYNVHRLVYSATFDNPNDAITHEKRLKRWRRAWKLKLIEEQNPQWRDLSEDFTGLSPPTLSFAELSAIQKLSSRS